MNPGGLSKDEVKKIQKEVKELVSKDGWQSLLADRIKAARLPVGRGSSFANPLYLDVSRAEEEKFYCFHALSRFLAFVGAGRNREGKGNVCVAIAVVYKTAYIAVNYETHDGTMEKQRPIPDPWGLLWDEQKRDPLFERIKGKVKALEQQEEKDSLHVLYENILGQNKDRVSSTSCDSLWGYSDEFVKGLDSDSVRLFNSLPPLRVGDTPDALLREVEKLYEMSRNHMDDGVYEPVLCAELFILNHVAHGLLSCEWPELFGADHSFFNLILEYSTWRALQTYVREKVILVARPVAVDSQTRKIWAQTVKVNIEAQDVDDSWMQEAANILGHLDSRASKPRLMRFIGYFALYEWVKDKANVARQGLIVFWKTKTQPAWFQLMKQAMKIFGDMEHVTVPEFEGKQITNSANAAQDMHCEVALFHYLTKMSFQVKNLPFYISRPLCGRCLCYFFGCIPEDSRPAPLAGSLLHRTQIIQFPEIASVKDGKDSFIDLADVLKDYPLFQ